MNLVANLGQENIDELLLRFPFPADLSLLERYHASGPNAFPKMTSANSNRQSLRDSSFFEMIIIHVPFKELYQALSISKLESTNEYGCTFRVERPFVLGIKQDGDAGDSVWCSTVL